MEIVLKYFPNLNKTQKNQLTSLLPIYEDWNQKINLISRKDIEYFYERHVLHSMALGKIFEPKAQTRFLDIGTGGGFPGIPLAILFPNCHFHLIDKIGKKIFAVQDMLKSLGLKNVLAEKKPAEELDASYDFVLTRAVTRAEFILEWSKNLIDEKSKNSLPNGCLMWKGGEILEEFSKTKNYKTHNLNNYFSEEFFETKKIIEVNFN